MLTRRLPRLLRRLGMAGRRMAGVDPISQYLRNGRIPWSAGYSKFKNHFIREVLDDASVMSRFQNDETLPAGFGPRLDERVVEIPWALAHIRPGEGRILDAGSVFNTPLVLDRPEIKQRTLVIYSLDLDWIQINPRVSYLLGDFRDPVLKDDLFETIVCISTLEHVGMWPTPKPPYQESLAKPQPPKNLHAYRQALAEFRRLLVPGGQLLLTVPFGPRDDQGWLQVFDGIGIDDIQNVFRGECRVETYYRYHAEGWQRASRGECVDAAFFNIVLTPEIAPDGAAAARAVTCLELVRT